MELYPLFSSFERNHILSMNSSFKTAQRTAIFMDYSYFGQVCAKLTRMSKNADMYAELNLMCIGKQRRC